MKVVCIPAFNAEKTVGDVVKKCLRYADKVFVCDDGSTDNTATLAKESGAQVVVHEQNRGYGGAIITLFETARKENSDVMITLDSDGQHKPEEIPLLVDALVKRNLDVVIGSRFLNGESHSPSYRKRGIKMITSTSNIGTDFKVTDSQSGFRAYSKRAIESIHPTEKGMSISTEILQKASNRDLRVGEVPITVIYGEHTSTQHPLKHGSSVLASTLKYISVRRPLTFYGIPGIIFVIIGSVYGYFFLHAYLHKGGVYLGSLAAGVIFFMVGTILLIASVILFTISTLMKDRQ